MMSTFFWSSAFRTLNFSTSPISFFRRAMSALAFPMSASSFEILPETVVWK